MKWNEAERRLAVQKVLKKMAAKKILERAANDVLVWEKSVNELLAKYKDEYKIDEKVVKKIIQIWKPFKMDKYVLMHNPDFHKRFRQNFIQVKDKAARKEIPEKMWSEDIRRYIKSYKDLNELRKTLPNRIVDKMVSIVDEFWEDDKYMVVYFSDIDIEIERMKRNLMFDRYKPPRGRPSDELINYTILKLFDGFNWYFKKSSGTVEQGRTVIIELINSFADREQIPQNKSGNEQLKKKHEYLIPSVKKRRIIESFEKNSAET